MTASLSAEVQAVYRALLQHPEWGLADIAQNTRLSEDEVRCALDQLTDRSLLHERADSGGGFIPVNPEVALTPALRRLEAELDARRAHLSRERAAIADLAAEYTALTTGRGSGDTERLVGVDSVRVRLMELSQRAESEVRTFVPGGALSPAALAAGRPLDEQNLARGVRIRTVFLESVRNDPATVDYATWLTSLGGATRTVPVLPMRMILCDDTAGIIPIDVDDSRQGAYLVRYPSLVKALGELFEMVWEHAAPLGARSEGDQDDAPSDRERALLKMLGAGLTDEGIARKMGVSLRTVRRHMAALLERLDAQSRFQAGAEAARRGWL
ncbi:MULTISPECIES: helix-turn-helix transcriptional regulator [unclassified Streptomyces]|uniref:helix-turn-helix domain-containing protein n=1 Tax=unclassified Streptomyces TaxID=2593676 RepID=UPI00236538D0|nr:MULTISPECIES: helix-turn-helix transcriptional regulator [unclassified Streptomyces]MDF3143697.1 helix-turn-helix transcriptional regulator [Streptomyces sp. T21Q-yed]WDF38137.1 helix-turn-helix transcriptional regulator [Streptomyces sp. T12]